MNKQQQIKEINNLGIKVGPDDKWSSIVSVLIKEVARLQKSVKWYEENKNNQNRMYW